MRLYGLFHVLLFAAHSWCCSLPPGVPAYSITDRTVLAPIVIHGLVLNISTTTRLNVRYDACVQVLEVIKGDPNLPREMCFGDFGGDYLCLNDVYENMKYIFFMNADMTARYRDGIPASAILANDRFLDMAKQGYCRPFTAIPSKPCDRPSVDRQILKPVMRVQEGQPAKLNCLGTGTFPLLVTWKKRDQQSYSRTYSNIYRIDSVTLSDMGVYECTIHNPAGRTTALVRLLVDRIPCGAFLYLRPGQQSEIKSPNYPQPYMTDKMCSWRICPSPGKRIKLDFKYFDLSRDIDDNLQIYHECDAVRSGAGKYCMTSNPGRLVSKCTSHCIQVWFQSTSRGFVRSKGFHATVTSTSEGTMTFDYHRLYCENKILLRFIPKEVYASEMKGQVLHNYKSNGPKQGQNIKINIDSSFIDVFGCGAEVEANLEYYVGLTVSSSTGSYTLNFVMLTDARNKPSLFDFNLNQFKTAKQDCSATPRPPSTTGTQQPTRQ